MLSTKPLRTRSVHLTLKEPRRNDYVPPRPFGLYGDGLAIHEILRLLLGSVNIEEQTGSKLVVINKNQLGVGGSRLCKPEKIVSLVISNEITLSDYKMLIEDVNARNTDFFVRLRRELTLALFCRKIGRHTESFLYMYRVLEMISLAIPMIYALTKSDFSNTHGFLKGLFSNERAGDLAALKAAVATIAAEGGLAPLKFDFSVSGREVSFVDELRSQITRCVLPDVRSLEIEDQGDTLFRVPFASMPAFFVTVRNRMFHYRIGEPNFDLSALGGSEALCDICLDQILFWFTHLYLEIVRVLATQIRR